MDDNTRPKLLEEKKLVRFLASSCLAILLVANTMAGSGFVAVALLGFDGNLMDASLAENATIANQAMLLAAVSILTLASLGVSAHTKTFTFLWIAIATNLLACTAFAILFLKGSTLENVTLLLFYAINAIGLWFLASNGGVPSTIE